MRVGTVDELIAVSPGPGHELALVVLAFAALPAGRKPSLNIDRPIAG